MAESSLKEKAYSALKQLILSGGFGSGEQLVERILVDKLQMSRTPIRQALERLEVEGFVSHTPNKGIIITETPIDRIVDLFDYRKLVESQVVKTLATRGLNPQQIDELKLNLEGQNNCLKEKNYAGYTELDMLFHTKLCIYSGNSVIIESMERVRDKLYMFAQKVLLKEPARASRTYIDHVQILESIMEGKSKQAEKIMSKHLDNAKRIISI
jgi:DNA-binding GntR family transcriptional regulator